jgi:hypothetical protein
MAVAVCVLFSPLDERRGVIHPMLYQLHALSA